MAVFDSVNDQGPVDSQSQYPFALAVCGQWPILWGKKSRPNMNEC